MIMIMIITIIIIIIITIIYMLLFKIKTKSHNVIGVYIFLGWVNDIRPRIKVNSVHTMLLII